MGLFDMFKKKAAPKAELTFPVMLAATANGKVVPMEEIPDPVFGAGVLGPCVGIDPTEGAVYSPVDGKISQVAETGHAIGIEAAGIELLIHVGVDTVDMQGKGFTPKVKEGQTVSKGDLLLNMDLAEIAAANHPSVVVNIVTNADDFVAVDVMATGDVTVGADFIQVSK